MALKRLGYIFIPVLAIILMSHNVSAYTDQQLMLNNYSIRETNGTWRRYDSFADGFYLFNFTNQGYYSTGFCGYLDHNTSVTVDNMNFDKGTYFTLNMPLTAGTGISPMAGPGGLSITHSGTGGTRVSVPWSIVSTNSFFVNNTDATSPFTSQYTFISLVGVLNADYNENSSTICMTQSSPTQPVIFDTFGVSGGQLGLGRANISFYYNQTDALKESIDAQNEKENQAISDIENQDSDDVEMADDSEAQSIVTSLSGIVNQLNDIPNGQNCNVTGNLGNVDLGNIDYCQGRDKLPFVVTFFAYVLELGLGILIGIMVYKRIVFMIGYARNG